MSLETVVTDFLGAAIWMTSALGMALLAIRVGAIRFAAKNGNSISGRGGFITVARWSLISACFATAVAVLVLALDRGGATLRWFAALAALSQVLLLGWMASGIGENLVRRLHRR